MFILRDEIFMKLALEQAKKANNNLEIPVGAVIVLPNGDIASKAYNQTEKRYSQASHAEVIAIEKAGKRLQDWRLDGCTLYVTLEPCLMCVGLVCLSRIERLVFGAKSPLFGCAIDIDNQVFPNLYNKHIKNITPGVLEEEAAILLKNFFKSKRNKGEQFRDC